MPKNGAFQNMGKILQITFRKPYYICSGKSRVKMTGPHRSTFQKT